MRFFHFCVFGFGLLWRLPATAAQSRGSAVFRYAPKRCVRPTTRSLWTMSRAVYQAKHLRKPRTSSLCVWRAVSPRIEVCGLQQTYTPTLCHLRSHDLKQCYTQSAACSLVLPWRVQPPPQPSTAHSFPGPIREVSEQASPPLAAAAAAAATPTAPLPQRPQEVCEALPLARPRPLPRQDESSSSGTQQSSN